MAVTPRTEGVRWGELGCNVRRYIWVKTGNRKSANRHIATAAVVLKPDAASLFKRVIIIILIIIMLIIIMIIIKGPRSDAVDEAEAPEGRERSGEDEDGDGRCLWRENKRTG